MSTIKGQGPPDAQDCLDKAGSGGQAQFIEPPTAPAMHGFAELTDWIMGRIDQPLTVADLARQTHLSERQLARRFVAETGLSPMQWVLHQRVLATRRLLETSDLPIEVIAQRTGLGTASTLRRHMRRATGVTPAAYRHTFQAE